MNTFRQDDSPYAAIDAKLAEIAKTSPPVAWRQAWTALGPNPTDEERLRVYQAMRDTNVLPPEAGFYLVAWQIDAITSERGETELQEFDERLQQIEANHGGDGLGGWSEGKAPPEYDETLNEHHAAWDRLFVRTLRDYGEEEIAELFEREPQRFEQLHEAGRQFFHGQEDWIDRFAREVMCCLLADDPIGSVGYRSREEDGYREVDVYPTSVELVGGATDGAVVAPGFSVDLVQLQSLFGHVEAMNWNTHGDHGSEAPFVSVEGEYDGKDVWLRVLCAAPDDEEPGLKLKVSR